LRPVPLRAADLRAGDLRAVALRAEDLRAAGLRVVLRAVDFLRPVVFFAANPSTSIHAPRRSSLELADSAVNRTSFDRAEHFSYHNCPEFALHKRAFNMLLSMKNNQGASISLIY